ncbi:hypothetical protein [Bacillus thuringiensis]|uniref:hypothetical protein n=1 Tax=Bacillus thuringiensis TaxID=1428 RepID=UPI000A3A8824|nr:hypothetical protein [Bacillus thuringiensis]OUA59992.1 hypothetical protein BK785_09960 [Bacillus thuringiensis serovar bolivia]OUA76733.1 hypothetical protein BK787_13090 [Bacillus thuringiensis serovar pahangi]
MDVIKSLLSLIETLKVPSPFFEVLAVGIVAFAFWYTYETIQSLRLDNQKKKLDNALLKKKLSQPVNNDPAPSAPTPGGETNL